MQKFLAFITLVFSSIAPVNASTGDMSVDDVIAGGCTATPANFSLDEFWNDKMKIIPSFCDHPEITETTVNGKRKPKAYVYGSPSSNHDLWAAAILSGDGETPDDLGISPNTDVQWGAFCSDALPIHYTAKEGDVVFSLREWTPNCQFLNPILKTIPVVGQSNDRVFIGNSRFADRVQISTGSNYGKAIDYYTTGSRRMSYAIPEFAGIVIALNSALIANNKPALTMANVKSVLDASSNEAYLEVNGVQKIYPEGQVDALLQQNPNNKYFGQIVNLQGAISFALTGSVGSSGGTGGDTGGGTGGGGSGISITALASVYSILLLD